MAGDPPAAPGGGHILRTETVDITPDKSLLTKAGNAEYSFVSAIAEQIDNAIQACRRCGRCEIRVTVRRLPKTASHMELVVEDTGEGMTLDDVKAFLTLGVSQSDRPDQDAPCALSGHISRFGVGAKRAAFYLGSGLRIASKAATSDSVVEAELSLETLERGGWKAVVNIREVSAQDPAGPSWTRLTISPLARTLPASVDPIDVDAFLREEQVAAKLSHYYHFFLHPDSYPGPPAAEAVGPFDILLNGCHLRDHATSLQRRYEESGIEPKVVVVPLELKHGGVVDVTMRLRYFPFISGVETLPIPPGFVGFSAGPDLETFPMEMRRPGLDVFWQGRLIPEAHIRSLAWMKPGVHKGDPIEERWLRRVHGEIFLTEHFAVTHSKMHLVMDDPDVRGLLANSTRKLIFDFREWVKNCHAQYDQDLRPAGAKYDEARQVTTYTQVERGPECLAVGDPVRTTSPYVILGRLGEIFHPGRPPDRGMPEFSCFIVHDYGDPVECRLRHVTRATDAELARFKVQQEAALPDSVRFYAQPDDVVEWVHTATDDPRLSFLLVVCSRDGRPVDARSWLRFQKHHRDRAAVDLTVRARGRTAFETSRTDVAAISEDGVKLASLNFKNCWRIPTEACEYTLQLVCRWNNKAVEFPLRVVAGPAARLEVESPPVAEVPLGQPLAPLVLWLADAVHNPLGTGGPIDPDKLRVAVAIRTPQFSLLPAPGASRSPAASRPPPQDGAAGPPPGDPAAPWRVEVDAQGRGRLVGLALAGTLGGGGSPAECILELRYKGLPAVDVPLTLCAGPPHRLDLPGAPFGPAAAPHRNFDDFPVLALRLRDRFSNPCGAHPDVSVEVRCPHLDPTTLTIPAAEGPDVTVEGLRVRASFPGDTWRPIVAQLGIRVLTRRGRGAPKALVQAHYDFTVQPSTAPTALRLTLATDPPPDAVACASPSLGMCDVTCPAATRLLLLLQVLNVEGLILTPDAHPVVRGGSVHAPWARDQAAAPHPAGYLLPPLPAPPLAGSVQYTVTFIPGPGSPSTGLSLSSSPIAVILQLTMVPNPPHRLMIESETVCQRVFCDLPFFIRVLLADRYGNPCDTPPPADVTLLPETDRADMGFGYKPVPQPTPGTLVFECIAAGRLDGELWEFMVRAQTGAAGGALRDTKAVFGLQAGVAARVLQSGGTAANPWVVTNCSSAEGITLTAVDRLGNVCRRINHPLAVRSVEAPLLAHPPTGFQFRAGVCAIAGLGIELPAAAPGPEGRDWGRVFAVQLGFVVPQESVVPDFPPLFVRVAPGLFPARLVVERLDGPVVASSALVNVALKILTEAGGPYTGPVESALIELDGVSHPLTASGGVFSAGQLAAPPAPGPHPWEARVCFASPVPPVDRHVTAAGSLVVVPDAPARLAIAAEDAKGRVLEAPVARNAGGATGRTLAALLRITVVDRFDNPCNGLAGPLEVTVLAVDAAGECAFEPPPSPPLLVGGRCALGPVVVAPSDCCKGLYHLLVSFRHPATRFEFRGALPFTVVDHSVTFRERQRLEQQIQTLTKDKGALQQALRQAERQRTADAHRLTATEGLVARHADQCVAAAGGVDLSTLASGVAALSRHPLTQDDLRAASAEDVRALQRAARNAAAGARRRPSRPPGGMPYSHSVQKILELDAAQQEASEIVGVLGEILRCEDEALAKALAVSSQVSLGTIVVKTDRGVPKARRHVGDGPLDVWSLQQVKPCQAAPDPATGRLLLPAIPEATAAAGVLGHAVNLVELDPAHEALRSTVVYNSFQHTMVVDTLPRAMELRRKVLAAGRHCPPLVALAGADYLSSIGIARFAGAGTRRPIFGSLPPEARPEVGRLEALAGALETLAVHLGDAEYLALRQRVREADAAIAGLRQTIKDADAAQAAARAELKQHQDAEKASRAHPHPRARAEAATPPDAAAPAPKRRRK